MIHRLFQKFHKRLRVASALRHANADTRRRLETIIPKRILVLCYGNIYRSPFVATLLQANLGNMLTVDSAGFHTKVDRPSPPEHVAMAAHHDVDLSQHRSKLVDKRTVQDADLIVIMDRHNWYALAEFDAAAVERTIWLGTLLKDGNVEIVDPYGKPRKEAERIVERLAQATQQLAQRLKTAS